MDACYGWPIAGANYPRTHLVYNTSAVYGSLRLFAFEDCLNLTNGQFSRVGYTRIAFTGQTHLNYFLLFPLPFLFLTNHPVRTTNNNSCAASTRVSFFTIRLQTTDSLEYLPFFACYYCTFCPCFAFCSCFSLWLSNGVAACENTKHSADDWFSLLSVSDGRRQD